MSKSKKNEIETWKAADAKVAAAYAKIEKAENEIERAECWIAYYEAAEAAEEARVHASAAQDALEVEDGDALAGACHVRCLRDDIVAELEKKARHEREILAIDARVATRIQHAKDSHEALVTRRAANGQPPPASLPSEPTRPSGLAGYGWQPPGPLAFVQVLEERIAAGGERRVSYRDEIRRARSELTDKLATLERQRREEEAKAAEAAEREADREYERQERAAREQAEREAWAAKQREFAEEKEQLAKAARARIAKGEKFTSAPPPPDPKTGWRSL